MLDNEADEISDDGTFSDLSNRPTTGHHNHHHQIVRLHQSREVKEFAVAVLKEASEAEWEDAELARLVHSVYVLLFLASFTHVILCHRLAVLIIKVLGLKYRAAWRLLNASCADMATATFLAQMKDEGRLLMVQTSTARRLTLNQCIRITNKCGKCHHNPPAQSDHLKRACIENLRVCGATRTRCKRPRNNCAGTVVCSIHFTLVVANQLHVARKCRRRFDERGSTSTLRGNSLRTL